MRSVFVLGAGASYFGGFPLAKTLLHFLKHDLDNTRDIIVGILGKQFFEFIKSVKSALPDKWKFENGEPDLEFVLALVDRLQQNKTDAIKPKNLLDDLDIVIRKANLINTNLLSQVRLDFATLVTSAFQYHSYKLRSKMENTSNSGLTGVAEAWANLIKKGDCIISFNWDLLHEIVLCKASKWTHQDGYDIPCGTDMNPNSSPTKILKLHGSCNWALTNYTDSNLCIDYVDIFFGTNSVNADSNPLGSTSDYGPSLILPSYLKNPYQVAILKSVWLKAEEFLANAERIIVLGYSLPSADHYARELFCKALQQNANLRPIELVLGSCCKAYEQWNNLCCQIGKKCIQKIQTFEEFVVQSRR